MPTTTIQLETEVRDELRARGRMGESYNDVIRRLLAVTEAKATARAEPTSRLALKPAKPLGPLRGVT